MREILTEFEKLLQTAGCDPHDQAAAWHLRDTIAGITSVIAAKKQSRPWGERNEDLSRVEQTAKELHEALTKLDHASAGALYQDRGIKVELAAEFVRLIQQGAQAAEQPVKAQRPPNAGAEEAVRLLIGFVMRRGRIGPSASPDSRFMRFARQALKLATGEEEDPSLVRPIQNVLKSGYVDVVAARISSRPIT